MAIPWLTLLKTVPWTDVIANAPTIANGAKKLWHSVSGRSPHLEVPAPDMGAGSSAEGEDLAKVQAELRGLRITITELHQQMLTSSELIRELAEQNTALIKRVEAYHTRLRWLAGAVALLSALVLANLAGLL